MIQHTSSCYTKVWPLIASVHYQTFHFEQIHSSRLVCGYVWPDATFCTIFSTVISTFRLFFPPHRFSTMISIFRLYSQNDVCLFFLNVAHRKNDHVYTLNIHFKGKGGALALFLGNVKDFSDWFDFRNGWDIAQQWPMEVDLTPKYQKVNRLCFYVSGATQFAEVKVFLRPCSIRHPSGFEQYEDSSLCSRFGCVFKRTSCWYRVRCTSWRAK